MNDLHSAFLYLALIANSNPSKHLDCPHGETIIVNIHWGWVPTEALGHVGSATYRVITIWRIFLDAEVAAQVPVSDRVMAISALIQWSKRRWHTCSDDN